MPRKKPTPTPDVLKVVADLVKPPVTEKPTDGSLSTANFEEGFVKPCSVCTRLWVAGVAFVPEQHPELCRECEKYPKAIMDVMERTGQAHIEVAHEKEPGLQELFKKADAEMAAARSTARSELAQANAFFARNGDLRVHGNFTINELYEAFKARLEYEGER